MMKNRLCKSLLCAILMGLLLVSAVYGHISAVTYAADEYKIYAEEGDIRDYITGQGSYFGVKHSFYSDSDGKVVYCLQSGMRGADASGTSGYQINNASILVSQDIVNRINEIVSRGYPTRFGTFIVGGTKSSPEYRTGLLIDDTIYKCTAEEARAATAFAVHRQMIEYQKVNPNVAIGNNKEILSYENGNQAVNDVVNIQEKIFEGGKKESASITIEWVMKDEDDDWIVANMPTPIEDDIDYIYVYAKIVSKDCVVNSISLMQGETYVQGAIVEDISYVTGFERIVKIKIPNNVENNESKVGIACNASTGTNSGITVMGNPSYQDVIVITNPNGICKTKEGYMPGGSGGLFKLDYDSKEPIEGVVFGVYKDFECTELIAEMTTDSDGRARIDELDNGVYYVKEIRAREGYILDTDVHEVVIEPNSIVGLFLYNKRIPIRVVVEKYDAENDSTVPQGDATLVGAEYGLYAREDIYRIDGYSSVVYSKDELVQKIVIGSSCKGYAKNLYPGKYYLKEITAPEGYVLDTTEYDVDCHVRKDDGETVIRSVVVKDKPIKQAFELLKIKEGSGKEEKPLSGAGFKAWLVSDLPVDENGKYDVTNCEPYPIGEDGNKEMFTDEDGYACSKELPYGTYLVRETTVPDGYIPVDDFVVKISEDSRVPQNLGKFVDKKEKTSVGFIKQDYDSGAAISGAVLVLENSEGDVIDRWESGLEPHIVNDLIVGEVYTLVEECAPEGYLKADDVVFTCELQEEEDGNFTVVMKDKAVKGKISIKKTGDIISQVVWQNNVDGGEEGADIYYSEAPLNNVEFKLFAADDIVNPDGSGEVIYIKGSEIGAAITNEQGVAIFEDLWLGEYLLVETKTSDEHILNQESVAVSLAYIDQNTEIVEYEYMLKNNRIESVITINKYDGDSGDPLAGAKFGLYAGEDIYGSDGAIVFPKDYLIVSQTSNEEGKAIFNNSLIPGEYYIKEIQAPDNYIKFPEESFFEIKAGENTDIILEAANYKRGIVLGESGTFTHSESEIQEDTQQKEAPQQVKTGDEFQSIVVVMLIVTMIAILLLVAFFRLKAR